MACLYVTLHTSCPHESLHLPCPGGAITCLLFLMVSLRFCASVGDHRLQLGEGCLRCCLSGNAFIVPPILMAALLVWESTLALVFSVCALKRPSHRLFCDRLPEALVQAPSRGCTSSCFGFLNVHPFSPWSVAIGQSRPVCFCSCALRSLVPLYYVLLGCSSLGGSVCCTGDNGLCGFGVVNKKRSFMDSNLTGGWS